MHRRNERGAMQHAQSLLQSAAPLFAALVAVVPISGNAATAFLEVLNNGTREVKRYEFGGQPFRVDVRFVPGWTVSGNQPAFLPVSRSRAWAVGAPPRRCCPTPVVA